MLFARDIFNIPKRAIVINLSNQICNVLNEPNVHGHVYRLFSDILGPYYLVLVLYVRSFGLRYCRLATRLLCYTQLCLCTLPYLCSM
jgi:hypothetical protein